MEEKVEKRRSSILKFKKPTTDNIQQVETVVKRRVSFSQKKFVKEFDASLNTMQNSTYEEIAKECDSGQSLDKMEVEENQFISHYSSTHVSAVQLASSVLLSQIAKDKENINPEKTILNCHTMDLTAFIPSNIQTLKNNHTVCRNDNMDLTNLRFNNEKTVMEEFNAETMDLTHVVCPVNRRSIFNATTRTEEMDFTVSVPCNRKVNRQSILNPETMDITCTIPSGDEPAIENVFRQGQFSNTLFGGKILKDTMELTNFICKNGNNSNKENCDVSIPQEQSSMDMDLTAVNDNCIEQVLPSNTNIINSLAPEIATAAQETPSLNNTKQEPPPINNINIKESSSNVLPIVESDKLLIGLNYAKEQSLPVYDVGGGIMEQIQNGSIKNKILTSPFLQIQALTRNSNKWDCDSRKNSLINCTTTNNSADDTEYLINFSVGGNKNPKSDFSRLIAGDFNPSFLSSKFLPLGEFESDAFTNEALESLQMNHTEPENQKLTEESIRKSTSKVKDCISFQKDVTQQRGKGTNEINSVHEHTESRNTLKRSYSDSSNDLRNKILKVEDLPGTDKTFTVVTGNTFSVMTEIIGTDTRNISDESVVSFCNNSSEDVLEIHTENVQSEQTNIQEETNKMDELKGVFEGLYNEFVAEISENERIMQKQIQKIEQRHLTYEKLQSHFDEICQKISKLLSVDFEIPIEKLKLNEADSSLEESEINSVSGCSSESSKIDKELQIMCEKVVTIQDRIEQLQKKCQNSWCLVSSTPEEYTFETLYHPIIFTVHIDRITGIVNHLHVQTKPDDDCSPKKIFIRNEFMKRMNSKTVSGAVGEKYDIVTLLDYVQMEMVHMNDMKKYFSDLSRIGFEMDSDFRVTLKIPSLIIRSVWVVIINMSDIDNIDQDCVSIKAQIGVVDEEKLKSLLEPCPRGFAFLKHLVVTLLNYLKMLENRKKSK